MDGFFFSFSFQGNVSFGLKRYVPPGFPRQKRFWFPNVFRNVQSVMEGDVRFYCSVKTIQGRAYRYNLSPGGFFCQGLLVLVSFWFFFLIVLLFSFSLPVFSFRLEYLHSTIYEVTIPYPLFNRLLRIFLTDWNSWDRSPNAARANRPLPTLRRRDATNSSWDASPVSISSKPARNPSCNKSRWTILTEPPRSIWRTITTHYSPCHTDAPLTNLRSPRPVSIEIHSLMTLWDFWICAKQDGDFFPIAARISAAN